MPVLVCHGSCRKGTLLSSFSAPPITPNPTPGFDGRAIRPVAVHWVVEGPCLLKPWGKRVNTPIFEEEVHKSGVPLFPGCISCTYPRIQRGQPPAVWRFCNHTTLPPVESRFTPLLYVNGVRGHDDPTPTHTAPPLTPYTATPFPDSHSISPYHLPPASYWLLPLVIRLGLGLGCGSVRCQGRLAV